MLTPFSFYRKVEGERKDLGHGAGEGTFEGTSVPLRRWEDWERSRLRKLRREERRRREMERAYPNGYPSQGEFLSPRPLETYSQYDGSDTASVTSSDDDHWGMQIGGYNENSTKFPPPPLGLAPSDTVIENAATLDAAEMEAMLEVGFDGLSSKEHLVPIHPRAAPPPPPLIASPRYQLHDTSPPPPRFNGYVPVSREGTPGNPHEHDLGLPPPPLSANGTSSAVPEWKGHAKKRSGGRGGDYGPLGPLDPDR